MTSIILRISRITVRVLMIVATLLLLHEMSMITTFPNVRFISLMTTETTRTRTFYSRGLEYAAFVKSKKEKDEIDVAVSVPEMLNDEVELAGEEEERQRYMHVLNVGSSEEEEFCETLMDCLVCFVRQIKYITIVYLLLLLCCPFSPIMYLL